MFGAVFAPPYRFIKRFIRPPSAMDYVAVIPYELTPHAMLGTGTPPFRQMRPCIPPLGVDVTVVPTSLAPENAQLILTPLGP